MAAMASVKCFFEEKTTGVVAVKDPQKYSLYLTEDNRKLSYEIFWNIVNDGNADSLQIQKNYFSLFSIVDTHPSLTNAEIFFSCLDCWSHASESQKHRKNIFKIPWYCGWHTSKSQKCRKKTLIIVFI